MSKLLHVKVFSFTLKVCDYSNIFELQTENSIILESDIGLRKPQFSIV